MEDAIFEQLVQQVPGEGRPGRRPTSCAQTERMVMLQVIDDQWKDHLLSMDHLKEGIGLRGYGQKDPLVEYKKESFDAVPGHDGPDRGRDHPVPVLPAGEHEARARRCRYPRKTKRKTSEEEARAAGPNEQQRQAREVHASRTSPATSSARRKRRWPSCIRRRRLGTGRQQVISRSKVGRNDPCPAAAARNTRSATGRSGVPGVALIRRRRGS